MIDYAGNKIEIDACLGCAYANHEFSLPTKIAYEDELFVLSQDWELPIQGFFVVSLKRHVENFSELTDIERNKLFEIANRTIKILKDNKICDRFNVIFEEKAGRHFHVWIMPRHKWMEELAGNIIGHLNDILSYALENFRTQENYDKIKEISEIVSREF